MPKVMLEYEVTTRGESALEQLASREERSVQRLKAAAAETSRVLATTGGGVTYAQYGRGIDQAASQAPKSALQSAAAFERAGGSSYALAALQASRARQVAEATQGAVTSGAAAAAQGGRMGAFSFRDMRGAMGAMTANLAESTPQLAGTAFQLSNFARMAVGLGPVGAAAVIAALGVGGRIIGGVARDEERRTRGLDIDEKSWAGDSAGLLGGVRDAAREMRDVVSSEETRLGQLQQLPTLLFQGMTGYDKASEKLRAYREGLDRVIETEERAAEIRYRQAQVGLARSAYQADMGEARRRGELTPIGAQGAAVGESLFLLQAQTAEEARLDHEAEQQRKKFRGMGYTDEGAPIKAVNNQLKRDKALLEETTQQAMTAAQRKGVEEAVALEQERYQREGAIARQAMQVRVGLVEQEAEITRTIRAAQVGIAQAEVTGGEDVRAAKSLALAQQAARDEIALVQATGAARVGQAERVYARLRGILEGQRAQDLITEKSYTDQVRALDEELYQVKRQGLQQYGQALAAALAQQTSAYQQHTERVRQLDREMRETRTSTADLSAEIRQAGMSPQEALADRETRALAKWREAATLTGEDQVAALRSVQSEYKALALAAAAAAKAQGASEDTFDVRPSSWRSTKPGEWSPAMRAAWDTKPGEIGSKEWWALGFTGSTGQLKSAEKGAAQQAENNVKTIGQQILAAQQKQRDASEGAAAAAKRMAESTTDAANEAKRLAAELAKSQASPGAAATASEDKSKKERVRETFAPDYGPAPESETTWGRVYDYDGSVFPSSGPDAVTPIGLPSSNAEGGVMRKTGWTYAHAGETILNERAQEAVRSLLGRGGRGGGGDLVVTFAPNGRDLVEVLRLPLQEAIDRGSIHVGGAR